MKQLDYYQTQLTAGKMSRREFIGRAVALGVTASAATMLADKAAKAAGPKKGGTFRQGLTGGATSDNLDPATFLDSYMINVGFGQLRNCLTEIDSNNQLIGELAESWEANAEGSTWTFKLRQGVEFHNGKTMDSTDVQASINHHLGEDSKSAAKGIIAAIQNVKTDGPNTVTFELSGGSADFPYLMSDYHLGICPAKADGSIDWESGVGTGGYVLENYEPGLRTNTKRNDNYWKEGAGYFDSIETLFIPDVTARTTALQTGALDGMQNIDLKTADLLKRRPGIEVLAFNGNQHITLPMLMDVAPFDNNDLRLALKYAIDRPEWQQKIFRGYASLGNDHPIGPANQFQATEAELPQREYDADKAKFHLKKSGHDSIDLTIHLAATAFEGAVDAGALYSESAKKAGINLTVAREPDDGYWSNVWLVKPWVGSYWGGRPTEDWMFSQVYAAGADWNETRFNNARFEELLVKGRAELNQDVRREIYVEMQRIMHDEGGAVIPLFMPYTGAVTDKVGLPEQMASNWGFDGEKAGERWWFV